MSLRNTLRLGLSCLILGSASLLSADDSGVIYDPNWKIRITPATKQTEALARQQRRELDRDFQKVTYLTSADSIPGPGPMLETPRQLPESLPVPSMTYSEAYRLVPFSRTEYEANPGYRHQAALEIMFRTLRPTTMVQQYQPHTIRYPEFYQYPAAIPGTQTINHQHNWIWPSTGTLSPFGYPYGLQGNR